MHLTACGGGQQAEHIYDATKMTTPFGTPTKRQVSKRPVSKRLKRQVYKTSGLQNVRFTKRQVFKTSGCKKHP
jgi:hypothetical protein